MNFRNQIARHLAEAIEGDDAQGGAASNNVLAQNLSEHLTQVGREGVARNKGARIPCDSSTRKA